MTGGMAMFQSELRSAVRDVRETPAAQPVAEARANPAASGLPKVTVLPPKSARKLARGRTPDSKRVVVRLWLPLTPLWLILAPFALLLAPVLLLLPPLMPDRQGAKAVRAAIAVRPYRTAFALGAVLFALSGTVVDVDAPDAIVRIRIF